MFLRNEIESSLKINSPALMSLVATTHLPTMSFVITLNGKHFPEFVNDSIILYIYMSKLPESESSWISWCCLLQKLQKNNY